MVKTCRLLRYLDVENYIYRNLFTSIWWSQKAWLIPDTRVYYPQPASLRSISCPGTPERMAGIIRNRWPVSPEYAREVLQGNISPVELTQYKGDFYLVPVSINGQNKELAISKRHMSYFAGLFKAEEEVAATGK